MLDTIGLTLRSQPIEFPAGRLVAARLGVPSATSIAAAVCPRKLITGPGVLVGRVEYANSDAVAAGAKVQITGSRTAGGGCVNYYIDDIAYRPGSGSELNRYMQPSELAVVEVYNASDVPSQYESSGSSSCTTIVMWTKTRIGG